MTALTMVDSLKSTAATINMLTRETALEFGDSTYRPAHRTHVPGVANKVADTLSRRFQYKDKPFVIPQVLTNVPELTLPARDISYYKSRC